VRRRFDFVRDQYRDSRNLKVRGALHAKFSTNPYPWFRWLFDHMNLSPGIQILEVGCGPGDLWDQNRDRVPARSRCLLTDISAGMVREAQTTLCEIVNFHFVVTDAQAVALSSSSVDVVIANQMLSHVPDVDHALEEIWRVLRPRGRLYAGTSGRNHMREVFEFLKRFDPNVTWSADETRFEFETAARYLKPRFQDIDLERFDNMLLVTEPAPLVDYVYSLSPPFVPAASRKTEFYNFVVRELEELGPMKITRDMGIVAATRS
jgi:ubiquinone/menaquinone biosynthesis C-methylase UbiE